MDDYLETALLNGKTALKDVKKLVGHRVVMKKRKKLRENAKILPTIKTQASRTDEEYKLDT